MDSTIDDSDGWTFVQAKKKSYDRVNKTYDRLRNKDSSYGTVQVAMLFWKELTHYRVNVLGFTFNLYDSCVCNKVIDGKQCTILWHVDDLKMFHMCQKEVLDHLIDKLNLRYGKDDPLVVVTRGTKHDCLGMTIDYSQEGKVVYDMFDFIDNILGEALDDMDGIATTPAANHLFTVNPEGVKLDREQQELFHTMVAKLLYLCKHTRPNTQYSHCHYLPDNTSDQSRHRRLW